TIRFSERIVFFLTKRACLGRDSAARLLNVVPHRCSRGWFSFSGGAIIQGPIVSQVMGQTAAASLQPCRAVEPAGAPLGSHKRDGRGRGDSFIGRSLTWMNAGNANREMRSSADGQGRPAHASSHTIEDVA